VKEHRRKTPSTGSPFHQESGLCGTPDVFEGMGILRDDGLSPAARPAHDLMRGEAHATPVGLTIILTLLCYPELVYSC
jgi:hypothetical protein